MSTRKSVRTKAAADEKVTVTPKKVDDKKPVESNPKPAADAKKSPGNPKPAMDAKKSPAVDKKPIAVKAAATDKPQSEKKPAEANPKPAADAKKSPVVDKTPIAVKATDKPKGEKRPAEDDPKPAADAKKSAVGDKKPIPAEPAASDKKPVVEQKKSTEAPVVAEEKSDKNEELENGVKSGEEKMEQDGDVEEKAAKKEESSEASTEKDQVKSADQATTESNDAEDEATVPDSKEADSHSEEVKAPEGFQVFNLKSDLLKGLEDCKIKVPSEVQNSCIPVAIQGKDFICQSSGIGKATSFIIAALQQIVPVDFMPEISMLIICHKRERAHFISDEIRKIGKHITTLRVAAYSGGRDLSRDEEYLKKSCPHIIVCTPGRLLSLMRTKIISLSHLKHVVIDKIDKMVQYDDLFEHLTNALEHLPEKKQMMIFCSNLTIESLPDISQFAHNPVEIFMDGKPKSQLRGVQQHFISITDDKVKIKKLLEILKALSSTRVIIFANTTETCMSVSKKLIDAGFPAVAVHRNQESGPDRDQDSCPGLDGHWVSCYMPGPSLDDEESSRHGDRGRRRPLMVATDLPYCNIDSMNIVINYDTPLDWTTYALRVTAAYPTSRDPTGNIAITFTSCEDDKEILQDTEKELGVEISEVPVDSDIFKKPL